MEQEEIFEIQDGKLIAYHAQLPEVTVPEGVTCIGVGAFRKVASLRSLTLPDGVTEICSKAFNGCYNLKTVHLPDSVRYIGSYAFEYCKRLETINMPRNLLEIGDHAFEQTRLSELSFPANLRKIGQSAFRGLDGLRALRFPASLSEIGARAFEFCSNLGNLYFCSTVKKIGDLAFAGCEKLDMINYADQVPEGAFCAPNAFSCTPYQKQTRIRIGGEALTDLGVTGWLREPDGSLYLENCGIEEWIEANSGEICYDYGTTFLVRFRMRQVPRYYLNCYYYAAPERIDEGALKRTKELHGGWIPLSGETHARELAENPEKAMDFIASHIRDTRLMPVQPFTPELLLDLNSAEAVNAAKLSSHAKIRTISATQKYRIAAVLWPDETLGCEVTPYSRNSGVHPVYDRTPVAAYRTYYVYPLSSTAFQRRLDDTDPEIVNREMAIMELKNRGYL